MNESKNFVKSYREAQASTGTYIDHRRWQNIHNRINTALMRARRQAEAAMTDAEEVRMQQTRQQMIEESTERGDTTLVNQVLGIYK
jgi:hypothetical protein